MTDVDEEKRAAGIVREHEKTMSDAAKHIRDALASQFPHTSRFQRNHDAQRVEAHLTKCGLVVVPMEPSEKYIERAVRVGCGRDCSWPECEKPKYWKEHQPNPPFHGRQEVQKIIEKAGIIARKNVAETCHYFGITIQRALATHAPDNGGG